MEIHTTEMNNRLELGTKTSFRWNVLEGCHMRRDMQGPGAAKVSQSYWKKKVAFGEAGNPGPFAEPAGGAASPGAGGDDSPGGEKRPPKNAKNVNVSMEGDHSAAAPPTPAAPSPGTMRQGGPDDGVPSRAPTRTTGGYVNARAKFASESAVVREKEEIKFDWLDDPMTVWDEARELGVEELDRTQVLRSGEFELCLGPKMRLEVWIGDELWLTPQPGSYSWKKRVKEKKLNPYGYRALQPGMEKTPHRQVGVFALFRMDPTIFDLRKSRVKLNLSVNNGAAVAVEGLLIPEGVVQSEVRWDQKIRLGHPEIDWIECRECKLEIFFQVLHLDLRWKQPSCLAIRPCSTLTDARFEVKQEIDLMHSRMVKKIEWRVLDITRRLNEGRPVLSPVFSVGGIDEVQFLFFPTGYSGTGTAKGGNPCAGPQPDRAPITEKGVRGMVAGGIGNNSGGATTTNRNVHAPAQATGGVLVHSPEQKKYTLDLSGEGRKMPVVGHEDAPPVVAGVNSNPNVVSPYMAAANAQHDISPERFMSEAVDMYNLWCGLFVCVPRGSAFLRFRLFIGEQYRDLSHFFSEEKGLSYGRGRFCRLAENCERDSKTGLILDSIKVGMVVHEATQNKVLISDEAPKSMLKVSLNPEVGAIQHVRSLFGEDLGQELEHWRAFKGTALDGGGDGGPGPAFASGRGGSRPPQHLGDPRARMSGRGMKSRREEAADQRREEAAGVDPTPAEDKEEAMRYGTEMSEKEKARAREKMELAAMEFAELDLNLSTEDLAAAGMRPSWNVKRDDGTRRSQQDERGGPRGRETVVEQGGGGLLRPSWNVCCNKVKRFSW